MKYAIQQTEKIIGINEYIQNKFIYDFAMDHYKGMQGIYFNYILKNIVEIGQLNKRTELKVLDFGCGLKKLKPFILNYTGYDVDPRFTEIDDWRNIEFDIIITNAVFMYMTKAELEEFITELYMYNPNVELIFGATKMNFLLKTAKILTGTIKGYADVKLTYEKQLEILLKYFEIIDKKSLLGLNEIYLMRFK